MIQSKKLFVIFAGIASLTLGAAVVFSAGDKNIDALRSSAAPVTGSITFDRSHRTESLGKGTFVFEGSTSINGNIIYMRSSNNTNYSLSTNLIAYFDSTNTDNNIQFYKDAECTKPFAFQNLLTVSITSKLASSSAKVTVYSQTIDGITYFGYNDPGEKAITSNSTTTYHAENARFLKISHTSASGNYAQITSLTINFKCENDYSENRYYKSDNVWYCLDMQANKFSKYNYSGNTVYFANFDIAYNDLNFTLTLTATNASSVSSFTNALFDSVTIGATNSTGRFEDGNIVISLYKNSDKTWYQHTFVMINY